MEVNACSDTAPTLLDADACIIGGGPAGVTLATELMRAGLQVVLVESGVRGAGPATDPLQAGDVTGLPPLDLEGSRARGIGGTSRIWTMAVDAAWGAKHVRLDPWDFTERPHAPHSGWPFDAQALGEWYDRAERLCGITDIAPSLPPFPAAAGLVPDRYRIGPATPFVTTLPGALAASDSATLLTEATAVAFVTTSSGRVQQVVWRSRAGGEGRITARQFVLAAGGLENARLLLLQAQAAGSGDAPGTAWLGRGLMEHPIARDLVLNSHRREFTESDFFTVQAAAGGCAVMGRLALTEALLKTDGLPNASVSVDEPTLPPVLQSSRARGLLRRLVPMQSVRRWLGQLGRASAARMPRADRPWSLVLNMEQWPDPANRVGLASSRDLFGVPRLHVHWSWSAADRALQARRNDALAMAFAAAGLGRLHVVSEPHPDPNAHHHAGTTRMHLDPSQGVVDPDGRVHWLENLYVVGNSTFPTCGFANPTLTVVALALRLAETLVRRSGGRATAPP